MSNQGVFMTKSKSTAKVGAPYSEAAVSFIVKNYGKVPNKNIASRLRRTTEGVRKKAKRLGLV